MPRPLLGPTLVGFCLLGACSRNESVTSRASSATNIASAPVSATTAAASYSEPSASPAQDEGASASPGALSRVLPDRAGPFTAGVLVTDPQFVRRQYSRGRKKITVTVAAVGATPLKFDDWLKMIAPSPAVQLDVPPNTGAGFYDCESNGTEGACSVHIHMRSGHHVEMMGDGTTNRSDFDALLPGLKLGALVER
jgi:hypothetical protein